MLTLAAEQGMRATKEQHGRGIQASVQVVDTRPTLAQIGITRNESSRYQQLAAMPAEHFETAERATKAGNVNQFIRRVSDDATPSPPTLSDMGITRDESGAWRRVSTL